MSDPAQCFVIDSGSSSLKIGVAGDDVPRVCEPAVICGDSCTFEICLENERLLFN